MSINKRLISTLKDLKSGIYQRLSSDIELMKQVNDVAEDYEKGSKFPYIVIGSVNATEWSSKTSAGQEVSLTLHTWSDYPGDLEVLSIHPYILNSISNEPINVGDDLIISLARLDSEEVIPNPDKKTRQGILILRFKIMEV